MLFASSRFYIECNNTDESIKKLQNLLKYLNFTNKYIMIVVMASNAKTVKLEVKRIYG